MKNKFLLAALLTCSAFTANSESDVATTVLAGGCFWCMESDYEKLEGVIDVVSGFSGGELKDPTYNGNHRGHYEVVEVTYNPEVVSYTEILNYYWLSIDPFDPTGQFCDKGSSYRSAIFVANDEERTIAETSKQQVQTQFPNDNVVTPILDAKIFYPIKGSESVHQDFYKNNKVRYNAYRWGCGRDKRTRAIWGDAAVH